MTKDANKMFLTALLLAAFPIITIVGGNLYNMQYEQERAHIVEYRVTR